MPDALAGGPPLRLISGLSLVGGMSSIPEHGDDRSDLLRELKYGAELSSARLGRVEERLDGMASLLERIAGLLERSESDYFRTEAGHLALLERIAGLLENRAASSDGDEVFLEDEDQEMARHAAGSSTCSPPTSNRRSASNSAYMVRPRAF